MLYNIFKGNSPYTILFIILTAILLWVPGFFHLPGKIFPFDILKMPFYGFFSGLVDSIYIEKLISLTLLVMTGLYLNRIASEYGFLKERSQLPALFFILINSAFPELQRLTPAILTGLLFVWAIERIFLSYRRESLSYQFFEASFLLSLASFFYLQVIFIWPLVFAALIIMRPVIWREWFTSLIGFLLPYTLLFGFEFIITGKLDGLVDRLLDQFSILHTDMLFRLPEKFFLVLMGIMTISGSVLMIQTLPARKIFARKVFLFLFWIFALSLVNYFIIINSSLELLLFCSVPLAFLFSEYFLQMRSKRRREFAFILFLIIVALSSFSGMIGL